MRTEEVRPYYESLKNKKVSIILKRVFDVILSAFMLIIFFPVFIVISIAIVIDSKGGVFFRQERVTQYGKKFRIFKFRTMIVNAEQIGTSVTVDKDARITKVGSVLRKFRLDEIPQLINILFGEMTFVGTRPEITKYVKCYTPEMLATLLLPAGITSEASIKYKNEAKLLESAQNIDEIYVNEILPKKMKYNLESVKKFSFLQEIFTMIKTVFYVVKG
ncbi:sugar transferase [Enterococcus faecium]|uniref:sugar transferase n=1 Tax=Enterococcus faecium TaxID=1352 RepID=UPI00202CF62B|nr:sugar transferase [Enterococcus faecium]MCL9978139.1 sugar transferase [Enterococcus faecium]